MGGQIRRFSPSANLSHKWLFFCSNYCVEFSFFISAPFTRAHPWHFALFAFTTFTERDQKTLEFSWKTSNVFLFFSDVFWKMSDVLWASSHVFESWLQFEDNGLLWRSLFPFFLSKKCLFSALVCEGCESKKVQIPGNAPAYHVRARKNVFFLEQNMTLIMSVSSRRNSPDFYIPFSRILAPKWEDSLQLNEEDGIPIKILWFRPVSLRWKLHIGVVLLCMVCKMSGRCRWNFTFSPFFLSLLPYRPIYKQRGWRRWGQKKRT